MSSLRDILGQVPQSPLHHPEGNVMGHTLLVRKSLPAAINIFEKERNDPDSPFASFSPLTEQETNILRIAAFMHDIGKASATAWTNDKGETTPWQAGEQGAGHWQSIGHENPEHYEPQMQKLQSPWRQIYEKASAQERQMVFHLIQNHMSFSTDRGLGKKLSNTFFQEDGKFINDPSNKLLIIFKLMDLIGRGGNHLPEAENMITQLKELAAVKQRRYASEQVKKNMTPEEFRQSLVAKGMTDDKIQTIMQAKYG